MPQHFLVFFAGHLTTHKLAMPIVKNQSEASFRISSSSAP